MACAGGRPQLGAQEIIAEHLPGTQREIAIRMPLLSAQFPANNVYDKAAIEIKKALDAGEDVMIVVKEILFYGSFMYLFGRLANDRSIEVVPGVSSLTACAAALGSPLSARNDVLSVIPGPLDAGIMSMRLAEADAAAIIKVGRHIAKIQVYWPVYPIMLVMLNVQPWLSNVS